jgi:chromosome segregation ATPase
MLKFSVVPYITTLRPHSNTIPDPHTNELATIIHAETPMNSLVKKLREQDDEIKALRTALAESESARNTHVVSSSRTITRNPRLAEKLELDGNVKDRQLRRLYQAGDINAVAMEIIALRDKKSNLILELRRAHDLQKATEKKLQTDKANVLEASRRIDDWIENLQATNQMLKEELRSADDENLSLKEEVKGLNATVGRLANTICDILATQKNPIGTASVLPQPHDQRGKHSAGG